MNLALKAQGHNLLLHYKDEIEEVKRNLAMNFDVPAQSIINQFFRNNGIDRFHQGNDMWAVIKAVENDTEYEAPPADLIKRWEGM